MKCFYFLDQSPFPLNYYLCEKSNEQTKWHRFLLMIPTILMFFVKLLLCVGSILLINFVAERNNTSYHIAIDIFLFSELIKIFVVVYQNFAYQELVGGIMRNFRTIESLFESTLSAPIQFTSLDRGYKRKICCAFGSYVTLLICFTIYFFLYGKLNFSDVLFQIMKFISISVYMNVIFFIDLVTFYLEHSNTIIAKENSDCLAVSGNVFVVRKARLVSLIREKLSKYKLIHFRLWKISEQLNEYLGWTLLTIPLQSFVELVIFSIWQLKMLNTAWTIMRLSREL